MPSIILGQKPRSGTLFYQSGDSFVNVTEETNKGPSKIFHKFVHKPKNNGSFKPEEIKIYKGIYDFHNCLKLKNDNGYSTAKLECVHVYFNQYDPDKTPLLFVLHFQNGEPKPQDVYYPRSNFEREIRSNTTKKISDLTRYSKENDILCDLIKENDSILEPITYNIGEKGENGGKYNNDKIKVVDDSASDTQLKTAGFKRYKHTPLPSGRGKKACVIYNCNALLKKGGTDPITEIQNQEYDSVSVYFGTKSKVKGTGATSTGSSNHEDVPLLVELVKKDSPGDTEYYVHKKNGSGQGDKYYWEKLTGTSGNTLKELLEDIGLNTTGSGRGFEALQKLMRSSGLTTGGDMGDLSGQLKQAKGRKLHQLLQQKVNGSSTGGKSLLVCLLERIQFNIVDSVVILLEKKASKYGEGEIQGAITNLDPPGKGTRINVLKLGNGGKEIQVNYETSGGSGSCVREYKYKVIEHDISKATNKVGSGFSAGIRFLIPTKGGASNSGSKYRELSLYNAGGASTGAGTDTGPQNLEYKYYTKSGVGNGVGVGEGDNSNKVYVVFYNGNGSDTKNGDPRPLLLCYKGQAYIPRTKETYFSEWVKVPGVSKCVCPPLERGDTLNQALLNALTQVVGFLNEVRLDKGPGTCDGTSQGSPGPPTSACPGENGQNTCTYEVDKFNGTPIKVNVECQNVNGSGCYKKLVHTPHGTNGKGDGFRLGDVKYGNDGSSKGSIDYYSSSPGNGNVSEKNKYKPLVKVTAYFYNQDKMYKDPLLVELEFKANGGAGPKEYYKLTSGGGKLTWTKDDEASGKVSNPSQLVKHLDEIRYSLKQLLKIELDKHSRYAVQLSRNPGKTSDFTPVQNGVPPNGNKEIQVQECTNGSCSELSSRHYKCYQHKITEGLGDQLNEVGGIALTLPSKNGPEKPIKIKLHNGDGGCENGNTDHEIKQLTYNKCMGDIYVFFYDKGGTGGMGVGNSVDSVPLMLWYNKKYYKPKTRNEYFTKWVCVSQLGEQGKKGPPCGSDKGASLAGKLDEVNKSLNVIELDKSREGAGYGLPTPPGGTTLSTDRVKVTTQTPKSHYAKNAYTRIIHRTKNGFEIGEIKYGQEITRHGITPGGGGHINVKRENGGGGNGNHKSQVATYNWNTVVAYYSQTDATKKLPQLIVILKTTEEVRGQDVKGTDTKYGYYILSTSNDFCSYYEYQWRDVKKPEKPLILDDKTDFSLLNSVIILLEQRGTTGGGPSNGYGDDQIKAAIGSAIGNRSITGSPGNTDSDINRLTGEKIKIQVKDESKQATYLKNTGFKCWTHDISALVELNKSLKSHLPGVSLIGGLRFLIPTRESGSYKQLTLKENGEPGSGGGLIMYHQPGRGDENNKVCVFFYQGETSGGDPRPLMMCYANQGYSAKNMEEYDKQVWHKESSVKSCDCTRPDGGKQVLEALVKVSNFLNPVKLDKTQWIIGCVRFYIIHSFNGNGIFINIDYKKGEKGFCYDRYTHTPTKGFRLGNIMYRDKCIKENSTPGPSNNQCITSVLNGEQAGKHKSADKVVVFYYKHDKDHLNPLMVVLCGSDEKKCKPYYTLKQKGKKDYEKKTHELDLSNKETLGDELDKVLFRNNKKLQVILDQRPLPQRYSPNLKQDSPICKGEHEENVEKELEKLRDNKQELLKKIAKQYEKDKKAISDYILYHVPEKICYKAQLYDNKGAPVDNGGSGNGKTSVKVTEVKSKDLKNGYRCFKHKLTEVKGIEEVGGLKLYLWKGQSTEIELFEEADSGILDPELLYCEKVDPVTYNTCKGNLYVYFYGEDPRPLMLCYDGKGYRAKCKEKYEKEWVLAPGVKCVCDDKGFEATKVLTQLYKLSMFLNEVDLGQTKRAFKSRDQPASHKYEVHKYNNTPVNVTVTGQDLSCYKQYTHRPQSGYRLGSICYNPDPPPKNGDCKGQCKTDHGIKYSESKQLISVSLYYYMYDRAHNWPLIVELGYKGELSDFYRLNDPGNKGKNGGGTDKKWEKMDGNTGSCKTPTNGENGSPGQNGRNGPRGPNGNNVQKDEKCQLDAEFARTAEELQRRIYESERGIPWDHNRYWYRVIDLEELIERRAYKIRKSLKLEYEPKDESTLILKTKDNCHEESVMGYVIGGGAVGVVY